jgi:DNA-directed RNA polymerase specialized sigma24 family protein
MGTATGVDDKGAGRTFPSTIWSLVLKLSSTPEQRREGVERLFRLYHGPILAHFRRTWPRLSAEEIEDLAAGFFARLLEKDAFPEVDARRARFRTFLKVLLDRYARDVHDQRLTESRGGRAKHLAFDGDRARLEELLADHQSLTPDQILDEVFRDDLLRRGVERLRDWAESTGRAHHFHAFREYALEGAEGKTYADVAGVVGVKESDVRNYIHGMRQRLEYELRDLIKPGVEDPDRDLEQEYRELFGGR